MVVVPEVPASWLVALVNGYGTRPRVVSGEQDRPREDLEALAGLPAVVRLARPDLVRIADGLWPVFAAPTPKEGADTLRRLLDGSRLAPTVDADGRSWWVTSRAGTAELVTAGCAVTLLAIVSTGGWSRLGTCDGADCADVYLDTSGRSRRYCSPTCLNRARVRAYRARQRS